MNVRVLLFAGHRERVGQGEVSLDLPDGATVATFAQAMSAHYPNLTHDSASLVVAVNQEYSDHHRSLEDGDEVALIPPVSGGSG